MVECECEVRVCVDFRYMAGFEVEGGWGVGDGTEGGGPEVADGEAAEDGYGLLEGLAKEGECCSGVVRSVWRVRGCGDGFVGILCVT